MQKKKVKIVVASHAGFCFGVKRAMDMAIKTLETKKGVVCAHGPLIHNPQAIDKLKEKGLKVIDKIDLIPKGAYFIVRSHGTTPDIIEKVKKRGAHIVDATCPFVKRAQKTAYEFYKKGYEVVICGDPNHPEVIGINAQTRNSAMVIRDPEEVKKKMIRIGISKKVGIMCQTTQKLDLLKGTISEFLKYARELEVKNTICLDSTTKQNEAIKLARRVDVMIIIGGKSSSNTTKLAELSRKTGTRTHHIEVPGELKRSWLKNAKIIGIAAGASTPDWLIKETIKTIKS